MVRLRFFFLLLVFSSQSFAIDTEQAAKLDFYLHTIDTGNHVYDNFGHTALRVYNQQTGDDVVFNWGIFDFRNPVDFSLNFYKGILNYRLGVYSYQTALSIYQAEKRTVWEDKLNLTPSEKQILWHRLVWNMQPENVEYQYHYFFNNCSTVLRDSIDECLSGQLKSTFTPQLTGLTFRQMVQDGYATNPEIQFPLDIIMNRNIDKEMNQWQKMFLPISLRQSLLILTLEKRPIVAESKVLFAFEPVKPYRLNAFQMVSIFMLFVLCLVFLRRRLKWALLIERLCLVPCFLFIFIASLFGLVMPLNWIFSAHLDIHHNANMLVFLPLDFFFLWPLFLMIFKSENFTLKPRLQAILHHFINLKIIGNVLFFILWVCGAFLQDVTHVALYLVPLITIILLIIKQSCPRVEPVRD